MARRTLRRAHFLGCMVRLAAVLAAAGLSGCANGLEGSSAGKTETGRLVDGRYLLSADEMALDCRRIHGRMQVRILELRGAEFKAETSELARGTRTVAGTLMVTHTAANAEARLARDRPMLEAYNRRLAELGCASYDLEKELAQRPSAPSPSPSIPPPAGKKPAQTKG